MKSPKYILTTASCFLIGLAVGALVIGRYTSRVSNYDIVSWDVDRVFHLLWLTEGRTADVINLNLKVVEDGITKTDYRVEYPGTEKQAALMADWIEKVYAKSDRRMPEHVSVWVAKNKLQK